MSVIGTIETVDIGYDSGGNDLTSGVPSDAAEEDFKSASLIACVMACDIACKC